MKRQMKTDAGEGQRDTLMAITGAAIVAPQATSDAPSWLRVKSDIRAGGGEPCQRRPKIRQFRRLKIRQIDEGTSLRSSRPPDGRGADAQERVPGPTRRAASARVPCAAACGNCCRES